MFNILNYSFILLTVFLTVYGQMIIKWQVLNAGDFPNDFFERINFMLHLIVNPWIVSAFIGAFIAALSWMIAMTKFDISHAYPFVSLSFILVLILSSIFFKEPVNMFKIIGLSLIIIGIIVGSRG